MSDEDGFDDTENPYEVWVFIGALMAMGIVAVTVGVWTWLEYSR